MGGRFVCTASTASSQRQFSIPSSDTLKEAPPPTPELGVHFWPPSQAVASEASHVAVLGLLLEGHPLGRIVQADGGSRLRAVWLFGGAESVLELRQRVPCGPASGQCRVLVLHSA